MIGILIGIYLMLGGTLAAAQQVASPRAVIEAKFAAVNRHALVDVIKLYAPDARIISSGFCAPRQGGEGVRRTYQYLLDSIPDLSARVISYVVEGDRVAVLFHTTGHLHGRPFKVQIANFFTVRDGLIQSDEGVYDTAGSPCAP
jgi:ketosteroid isomerase-like protein